MRLGFVFLICLTLITTGCLSDQGRDDPSAPLEMSVPTIDEDWSEAPGALVEGVLEVEVSEDVVFFILLTEGTRYGLVFWPDTSALNGDTVQLISPDGEVLASAGETVAVGGGEFPHGEQFWGGGPEVDGLWLASEVKTVGG